MSNETNVKVVYADPSALGLFGLAMVTWVASYQKLNPEMGLSYVIPWAIFLGAFAQLMAAILSPKKPSFMSQDVPTAIQKKAYAPKAVVPKVLFFLESMIAAMSCAKAPRKIAHGMT